MFTVLYRHDLPVTFTSAMLRMGVANVANSRARACENHSTKACDSSNSARVPSI